MANWVQCVAAWLASVAGFASAAPAHPRSVGDHRAPKGQTPSAGGSPGANRSRSLGIRNARWVQAGFVLLDLVCVSVSAVLAFSLRFASRPAQQILGAKGPELSHGFPLSQYGAFLLLYGALVVLFCQSQHLYRTLPERDGTGESLAVLRAVTLATLLLTAFIYLSGVKIISRLVVGLSGVLNLVFLSAWRWAKRRLLIRGVIRGAGARHALIIGTGAVGQALATHFDRNLQLGYRVKGFLDGNGSTDPRVLGMIEDFDRVVRTEFVDEVFITEPGEHQLVQRLVAEARRLRLGVKIVPELYDGLGWEAPIRYVGPFPVMELHSEPIPAVGLFCKRVLDSALSAFGLVALSPVFLAIAAAIRLDSEGPILYCSPRVGKRGSKFTCYKFRTMVANADALKEELRSRNERNGPFFKVADDPRVTRVGRFLRKYSLDESPQLWNVLRGEMSLVGPRPHPLDDYARYDLEHLRRLDVKPGITGLWQVTARQDPSFERNIALDLEYIERWNFWLDFQILLQTVPEILQGRGQ
ncbi:MAG TPA: sugar transferase [Candidatus Acidoferrales bacterium]|nr:sugar transferase [Candidatus Acidoferrales bacterium]